VIFNTGSDGNEYGNSATVSSPTNFPASTQFDTGWQDLGISFLPATQHPTSTTVSCTPTSVAVNQPTTCTATVTDTSGSPTTPTGTVTFSSGSSGSFSPSTTCTLSSISSSSSSCSVSYTPNPGTEGTQTITGTYSGESTHQGSTGTFSLTVTKRTTTTSVSCSVAFLTDHHATPCTATVTDTSPGTPITPSGTVAWTSSGEGTFSPNPCVLSGAGPTATCTVTYTASPGKPLPRTITGTYSGDTDHFGSSGSTTIAVSWKKTEPTKDNSRPTPPLFFIEQRPRARVVCFIVLCRQSL